MSSESNFAEKLRVFYKENAYIIDLVVKTIILFLIYTTIFSSDYSHSRLEFLTNSFIRGLIVLSFTLLSVLLSSKTALFLMFLAVPIALSSSLSLAAITFFVLMTIYILYGSISRYTSFVILFTIACFYLKIPYVVPVLFGIKYKRLNFLPIIFGVFIYYFFNASNNTFNDLMLLEKFPNLIEEFVFCSFGLLGYILSNIKMIYIIAIFTIVNLVCEFLKYSQINNNREVSIIVSGTIFIIGAIAEMIIFSGGNTVIAIISIIVSMVITYLLCLLDFTVDYKKTEKVFFQDDNNVYYVKIVPKVK